MVCLSHINITFPIVSRNQTTIIAASTDKKSAKKNEINNIVCEKSASLNATSPMNIDFFLPYSL